MISFLFTALLQARMPLPLAANEPGSSAGIEEPLDGGDAFSLEDVPELAGLQDRWRTAADSLLVSGYSVGIVIDGELRALDSYGYGGAGQTRPIDADSMFYIASITKTYTAFALAKLENEFELILDDPVQEYLPRFELANEDAAATITVRDLLCHLPGINQGPIVLLDAYTGQITEDRFYYWLRQAEPTQQVTYTNVHFTIAGRVIESVTGMSWKEYLRDGVFFPSGMDRTTAYASLMYSDSNSAFPMLYDGTEWLEASVRKDDSVMHAAGGMGTTARDGARWIELHVNGGSVAGEEVVPQAVIDQMLEPQSEMLKPRGENPRLTHFGLGWWLGTYRGHRYAQHGGGYVASAAKISFLPDAKHGVVVLCNSSPGGQLFGDIATADVYDRLLGEAGHRDPLPQRIREIQSGMANRQADRAEILSGPAATLESIAVDPALCQGLFHNEHWGELRFQVDDGRLTGNFGNMQFLITATEKPHQVRAVVVDSGNDYILDFIVKESGVDTVILDPGDDGVEFVRVE